MRELIYAGKEGGGPSVGQAEIERLLLEHGRRRARGGAAQGWRSVRVRARGRGGGDPARGRDRLRGRPRRSPPGSPPARMPASRLPTATPPARWPSSPATRIPTSPNRRWTGRALAAFPGTLVVYMGVRQLPAITERLIAGGPLAAGARGDRLARHAARSARGRGHAWPRSPRGGRGRDPGPGDHPVRRRWPALRERLEWFERRPLSGVTVAVTRARAQASGLAAALRELGAQALEAPAIRIAPLDGPVPDLSRYDLVCLTSPNGVRLLLERMAAAGLDARALAGARVAAIGPGTARGPARARRARRHRARAVRGRRSGGRAGRHPGDPGARGPGGQGTRRAARCPARAGGRGRRRGAV